MVVLDIVHRERFPKELCEDGSRCFQVSSDFRGEVRTAVDLEVGCDRAEIVMAANVIPVCVRDEEGGERRQALDVLLERFEGLLRGVRTGAGIDRDQLLA